jgi:hypothetical protein
VAILMRRAPFAAMLSADFACTARSGDAGLVQLTLDQH